MDVPETINNDIEEVILPICDKKSVLKENRPELLLVSTLDGTLTALDPTNNGRTLWSVATGNF